MGTAEIRGTAKVDSRTKNLIERLSPADIAVIDHRDLDLVAAEGLARAKVKAVINASPSISGRYPNLGPRVLVEAGIVLLDNVGPEIMRVKEGAILEIQGNEVFLKGALIARGIWLDKARVELLTAQARENLGEELDKFVQNTLNYALKEKSLILGDIIPREFNYEFAGRQVLVVVRGNHYREDLSALTSYIREVKPILIGVDGGADILLERGMRPDILIGDMDSVTDEALRCGAKVIVHAYPDGRAPGESRVKTLGVNYSLFPAAGTSEDIAMLLAYDCGADLIVAVGTHSNMIDFLEKGRQGMSSTFLVRLKVGSILVDARGVSRLYKSRLRMSHLLTLIFAALLPLLALVLVSKSPPPILRFLWIRIKIMLGI